MKVKHNILILSRSIEESRHTRTSMLILLAGPAVFFPCMVPGVLSILYKLVTSRSSSMNDLPVALFKLVALSWMKLIKLTSTSSTK